MGKSSTAKRLKNEWCKGKVFDNHNLIYYDSKKINRQLANQSNAAALLFSELGDHLKKKGRTIDDLLIYNCVKTIINNLIIVIDGVDEFPVKGLVTGDYVDELERKINNNEEIAGTETICAIYFGFLFPYSKVILLGRIGEFESLKKVKVKRDASIFNLNRKTKDLRLLEFDDGNIKDLSCLRICSQPSQQTICTGACQEIYKKIKNIELCKNPTDLNSLIELHKRHPNEDVGKITRTKLIIATLLSRLTNHNKQQNNFTFKTFREISKQRDFSKYLNCICTMGEVSLESLLINNVSVQVDEIRDSNGVVYFEDENHICIERETLEELDLFYVRNLDYYFILEPQHTLYIEFLSACYFFLHPGEWISILELNIDRQLEIIKFIAGLHADDYFTKDFVNNVLNTSSYSLERFFSWLYSENVRWSLPNGGRGYECWFGLMENQNISPSFFLLDSISHEVEIPETFIPKTTVCYCDGHLSLYFEWYRMKYLKHNFSTNLSDQLNIESFLNKFPSYKFIIKGDIRIMNEDELNRFDQCRTNNLITFKINILHLSTKIYTSFDTRFSSYFKLNTLYIGTKCDSRTINMILNALSLTPSNTQQTLRLHIHNIHHFNFQQIKTLFKLGLSGVIDNIGLSRDTYFTNDHIATAFYSTFFTDEQITILENVEQNTRKLINAELWNVRFHQMFELPNLGNRHLSLYDLRDVTDNDLNKLKEQITPGYSNNLANYKIMYPLVPFVRKEKSSQNCEHSMFLHLSSVDLKQVSSGVFADTFSIIPSLSCKDNELIPSSHWLSLSQVNDCRINEMRIWNPQLYNFDYFLNIKTNIQFICISKDHLKLLLNHIVNNPNVLLHKEIKVFVVKFDPCDWDYYDEIMLYSRKTIKEYKKDNESVFSILDNISVPYHEGEQHLRWWCCEISPTTRKNNRLWLIRLGFGFAFGIGWLLENRFMC